MSNRGAGYLFGKDPVELFSKTNNISLITRAHQLVMEQDYHASKLLPAAPSVRAVSATAVPLPATEAQRHRASKVHELYELPDSVSRCLCGVTMCRSICTGLPRADHRGDSGLWAALRLRHRRRQSELP